MLIIELVLLSLALWSAQAFDWHEEDNGKVKWADNCDFSGADIGSSRSTGQDCAALCYRRQGCTRFSWNHHDGGTCWFKSGGGDALYSSNGGSCGYVRKRTPEMRQAMERRRIRDMLFKGPLVTDNHCTSHADCATDQRILTR